MVRYIIKRLFALIPVILVLTFIVFTILSMTPGDATSIILGSEYTEELGAKLRVQLGLDRPLIVQYFHYITNLVQGDFGMSYVMRAPVIDQLSARLANTAWIVACAMILCVSLGIPIGILSATRPNSFFSQCTMVFGLMGVSMPIFWLGLLLILLFSVKLGWFQAGGFDGWGQGVGHAVKSLLLPAAALGLFQFAVLARTTRSALLEVLREEYVKTARAKGVAERGVIFRHALKNAMIPILTVAGVQLGQLMAGSIVLETVFYLPGLGRLAIGAISARDLPVVQGVVLFVASMIVLINVAVDVLYGFLDPRIRYE